MTTDQLVLLMRQWPVRKNGTEWSVASASQLQHKLSEPAMLNRAAEIIMTYWPNSRQVADEGYIVALRQVLGNQPAAVVCVLLHVWAESGHDFPPKITEMIPPVRRFCRWHRQAHEEYLKHEEAVRAAY